MEEKIDYYLNYPYSFNIKEFTDILNYIQLTCEICSTSFNSIYHLKRHQRIHTKEKPHKCQVCNKSFSRKDILTKHMLIHTKEKNYECKKCERKFTQSGTLVRHARICNK